MEIGYKEALLEAAEKIMVRGGKLEFIVIKRGNERISEVYTYVDNKIRCRTETLTE